MTVPKYRATWEQVSTLDADHIASWGALSGYSGPITFDDTEPAKIHAEHNPERDEFSAFYVWKGNDDGAGPIRSTVRLERRPCRFGGTRAYFICPLCARRTLRLAVLPRGLCCGTCGRITWASRRETETQRLVRKANKIACRLGLDYFGDAPKRPSHMRAETYAKIMAELEPLKAEINRRVAMRMARAKGPLGAFPALARWGL
ncbi:MAG: hypothetical protein AB7P23_02405 [Amphiplicatus sp.]